MADQTDISTQLSQLLEQYLALLDQYQSLQTKLSQLLSSGYISLAQANFSSSTGNRYGQDYYDERMQATRKLRIISPSGNDDVVPSLELIDAREEIDVVGEEKTVKANSPTDEKAATPKAKLKSRDPLHWFGILVPPALRTVQREFTGAVVDVVPKLVEVIAEMRIYGVKIEETRRLLDAKRGS